MGQIKSFTTSLMADLRLYINIVFFSGALMEHFIGGITPGLRPTYFPFFNYRKFHRRCERKAEIGKNERDRRSFPFSSVQFMNLAHIFADF